MATYVLVICTLCVLAVASEKPTYEEILIAAKAGVMPNSVPKGPDRVDSGHDLEGMNGIFNRYSYKNAIFKSHAHLPFVSSSGLILIYVTMYS